MDYKNRILKMLEEGKITADEAYKLLSVEERQYDQTNQEKFESRDGHQGYDYDVNETYSDYTEQTNQREHTFKSQKKQDNEQFRTGHRNNSEDKISDFFTQFTDEFQKLFNKDKANEAYHNVKSQFENQKQAQQFFSSVEKAFDSVRNSDFEAMFTQGPKNKLIETVSSQFNSVSIDVTNGNIKVVPTTKVTTAKIEVSSFYSKLDQKRNYFKDIICEVKNNELVIVSDIKTAKVNVELQVNPTTLKRLIISGSNGSVFVESQDYNDVSIDLINGNVKLKDVNSHNMFVRTSRGNIVIEDGNYTNLELVSMVGQVDTGKSNAKDLTVSANGSVNIVLNQTTESVSVNTNMGSINLAVPRERQLEGRLSTVVGSINYPPDVNVRTMKHQDIGLKEIMLLNDSDDVGLFIEANTKFGSVTLHRP